MTRIGCGGLCVLGLMFMTLPASAGSVPEQFTLGRYVPGNVWLYMHEVHNPERAFIDKEYAEVFEAFHKSGIINDVKSLVMSNIPSEEDKAKANEALSTAVKLLESVEWGRMTEKEFVYAHRMQAPMPEYVFLFRGAEGSGEKNFKGLRDIVHSIVGFATEAMKQNMPQGEGAPPMPVLEFKQIDGNDNQWTLAFPIPMPYSLDLVRDGDVIGIILGASISGEVRGLMSGKGAVPSIVDNARFREALSQVPSPENGMEFFDVKMMFENINGIVQMALSQGGPGEEIEKIRAVIGKVRGMIDFVDYVLVTHETEGVRDIGTSVCRIQAEKKDSPICKALTDRKAFDAFDKYIPADATGFSMGTGINFGLLYTTIINFIEKDVPEGAAAIAEYRAKLAEVGFDPEKDIFSWLSGEYVVIELPSSGPASPMGMGGGEFALMLRVSDAAKAKERLNTFVEKAKANLPPEAQQQVAINAATGVSAEGFHEVKIMQLAMMMPGLVPVFGVAGDWLCVASSAAAVNKCLATASGDAPSIKTNERFQKEGLTPTGPVTSVNFTDLSNMGQELGMVFGMMGMMSMAVPPGPEGKPARDMLTILTKLGPVMAKLDFFSSEASMTTFDGTTWKTKSVITYKDPKASAPAADSGASSSGKP